MPLATIRPQSRQDVTAQKLRSAVRNWLSIDVNVKMFSEELALEREKRANKNDALRQGMGTAAGGLMLLNGVVGTVGVLKSVF